MEIALVHDYLTQRGGAERVVLAMLKAFPGAPLYTSLYEPRTTFPEFSEANVRTLVINRARTLRRNHRLALPVLAPAFSKLEVSADVVLCSSSGWSHGVRSEGRKVVYCYSPARWLYQSDLYLGSWNGAVVPRVALAMLGSSLRRWDQRAAARADRYLTSSSAVRAQIRDLYALDAEVLPPPVPVTSSGAQRGVAALEPGYFLCVSRLVPHKNIGVIVEAFAGMPRERLTVVGSGPDEQRLRAAASPNVRFLGAVSDDELRWLYANSAAVVAASHEDYGLTPLEGAALGRPAAVLRWGGFLETVVEGVTGVFFDRPEPDQIRAAVEQLRSEDWDVGRLKSHAERFSEERFISRLREVVAEEAQAG